MIVNTCSSTYDSTTKVSPSKHGLPHMGRAMTDTQELRQVSCLSHIAFYVYVYVSVSHEGGFAIPICMPH